METILSKARALFGSRNKPRCDQPRKQDLATSSEQFSSHNELHIPDSPTPRIGSISSCSVANPIIDPAIANMQVVPLTAGTSAESLKNLGSGDTKSSWDLAYDRLRATNGELLEKYEQLLAKELEDENESHNVGESENRIDKLNRNHREEQLKAIIDKGLRRSKERKISYTIFGKTFTPRDQVARTAEFVQSLKTLIDQAVKASPEAALAWAGVCTILPLLINPSSADIAQQEGFIYVTSRMRFYAELERYVWPASLDRATKLRLEFEDSLTELYRHFLEFQIKVVMRLYSRRLARLKDDVVYYDSWKAKVDVIKTLEKTIHEDLDKISNISLRTELENLNLKAAGFLKALTSTMSIATGTRKSASSDSFIHSGHGNQYNASRRGVQYNNTGNGPQINGSTIYRSL